MKVIQQFAALIPIVVLFNVAIHLFFPTPLAASQTGQFCGYDDQGPYYCPAGQFCLTKYISIPCGSEADCRRIFPKGQCGTSNTQPQPTVNPPTPTPTIIQPTPTPLPSTQEYRCGGAACVNSNDPRCVCNPTPTAQIAIPTPTPTQSPFFQNKFCSADTDCSPEEQCHICQPCKEGLCLMIPCAQVCIKKQTTVIPPPVSMQITQRKGDINNDGKTDIFDGILFLFPLKNRNNFAMDINKDNKITYNDFIEFITLIVFPSQ